MWCHICLGWYDLSLLYRVAGNKHVFHDLPVHFFFLIQLLPFCLLWIEQTFWLINHILQQVLSGICLYQHMQHNTVLLLVHHIWQYLHASEPKSFKLASISFDSITYCFVIIFFNYLGTKKMCDLPDSSKVLKLLVKRFIYESFYSLDPLLIFKKVMRAS